MARVAIAFVEVRPNLDLFAATLNTELAKIDAVKTVELKADTKGLNAEITRAARRHVRPITQKIKPEVDDKEVNALAGKFRTMAKGFGGGTIGRVISTTFKMVAGVIETTTTIAGKAIESLGKKIFALSDQAGPLGEMMTKLGAQVIAAGGPIGAVVGAVIGLAAAVGVLVAGMGALQFALAGILGIVVPLIAGITALVGEMMALAAAIGASLALIPGIILVATAAFGPLLLVMEKIQGLFEKTADAVGPLYEVMERLKNAIFAVISSGFVEALQTFAATVLPRLFIGIERVANAWGLLLTGLVKLASAPGVIEAINQALVFGAQIVTTMANAAKQLGPAFLSMAVEALPALTAMLADVVSLVGWVGQLVDAFVKSGAAKVVFSDLTGLLHEALGLFRQLAPLAFSFMSVAIGPATRFIKVLAQIAKGLGDMLATPEGAAALADFFNAMNVIVGEFGALLIGAMPDIVEFGSIISEAMVAARPLAQALLDTLMTLLREVTPGMNEFMKRMVDVLADPGVQGAVAALGASLGDLLVVFADTDTILTFVNALSFFVDIIKLVAEWLNIIAPALKLFLAAVQATTGDIRGAMRTMSTNVISDLDKMGVKTTKAGSTWDAMRKTGVKAFGDIAGASTALANAPSWQAIIDNSGAAAKSLNEMGRAAYQAGNQTDIQTYEKTLVRIHNAATRAKKVGAPKVDTGLGTDWMSGFNSSLDSAAGKSATTAKKIKNAFVTNLKPTLTSLNLMTLIKGGKAYNTGKELAVYFAKGITSGSKNIARAAKVIYAKNKVALNNFATKLTSFATKSKALTAALPSTWAKDLKKMTSVAQLDAYFAKAKAGWQTMLEDILEFKDNVRNALVPDRGLVGVFGYFPTPAEVKARFDKQLAEMTRFAEGIKALQAKGLDPELARQWLTAGVEGAGNMVTGLQNATEAEIRGISDAYKAVNTEAERVAEEQTVAWKGVGQKTVEGYIAGIQSMQDLVTKTMVAMMKSAQAAAKKALGIKSPSSVFDSIGVQTIAGYIRGVDSMVGDTVSAVGDLYQSVASIPPSTLTPQIKPGLANVGTLAGVAETAPDNINVRVYIGDRELTDIARVVVENADTGRARALLAGRRGG